MGREGGTGGGKVDESGGQVRGAVTYPPIHLFGCASTLAHPAPSEVYTCDISRPSRPPPADVLWVLQVDAIVDFERQMAPFLGALNLVRIQPACAMTRIKMNFDGFQMTVIGPPNLVSRGVTAYVAPRSPPGQGPDDSKPPSPPSDPNPMGPLLPSLTSASGSGRSTPTYSRWPPAAAWASAG